MYKTPLSPAVSAASDGFTLIELLIGVSVLAILLSIGIPSFNSLIQSNRLTAETNEFITALTLARSEASKRGVRVSVCGLNAAGNNCDGSVSWSRGWIVFVDDSGTTGTLDGADVLLQRWPASGGFTYGSPTASPFVAFLPTKAQAEATVEIYKDGCSGEKKRRIEVKSTGRVSLSKVAC